MAKTGKSKSKFKATTSFTEARFNYLDGSFLLFKNEVELTQFLTYFANRAVATPRFLLETHISRQEGLRYPGCSAPTIRVISLHLQVPEEHQSRTCSGILLQPSDLRREGDIIYSMVRSQLIELSVERLRRIVGLPFQGVDISHFGGEDWVLNNLGLFIKELDISELIQYATGRLTIHSIPLENQLLLYIIAWILKPRDRSHMTMFGEDLKIIHAIMHLAPINWAKFVMIHMADAATTAHNRILPYAFLVIEILECKKITITTWPLTKATNIWTIDDQTFKKRSESGTPASCQTDAHDRATIGSIADFIRCLSPTIDEMGSAMERIDMTLQRQGYAMQSYFDCVNYLPVPYPYNFLGQEYTIHSSAFVERVVVFATRRMSDASMHAHDNTQQLGGEHADVETEASSFMPQQNAGQPNVPLNTGNNQNFGNQPEAAMPAFMAQFLQQMANAPMF
ncbi:unnamed protein product [Cuscuta campestris]|uniref:Uncharacterized protein n=1 Tax=Cuscuta campestris TaxID=132261 RepID=A0A484L4I3_9ASTE|nr:unnamed protein product [Cuscuta campestris]